MAGNSSQPQRYCTNCGAEVRSGTSFCVSCGNRTQESDVYEATVLGASMGTKDGGRTSLLSKHELRIVSLVAGVLLLLVLTYLLLSLSVLLGLLFLVMLGITILFVRKNRGSQSVSEQRLFESVGRYKQSTQRFYEEGKHRKLAQNTYQQSRRAFQAADIQYRSWRENQAAERERMETFRAIERERNRRWDELTRYKAFFERAYAGSRTSWDWWQAYQDEEVEGQQPSVSSLLQSANDKSEEGRKRITKLEETIPHLLQQDRFGEVDKQLDALREGQEDFRGRESVFVPLVEVHNRIKRFEEWNNYRQELERFIKDLEDLLSSPAVRTSAANRVRFPDPNNGTSLQRNPPQAMGGFSGPTASAPSGSPKEYIDSVVPYMLGRGFSIENRSDTHVTFVRNGEEMDGGTCLVIAVLMLAGLLPGILYAIYLNTRQLHTTLTASIIDGELRLAASGNDKGGRSTLESWIVTQDGFR